MLGPMWRKIFTMIAGGVVGQGAMIAVIPLLPLLYTPDDIGRFAIYTSIISLALPFISLRLEIAIPLARNEIESCIIFIMSIACCSLNSLLYAGILFFTRDHWPDAIRSILYEHIFLIGFTVWSSGVFAIVQYVAVKGGNFASISKSNALRGMLGAGTQTALGCTNAGAIGLILGQSLYMGSGSFFFLIRIISDNFSTLRFPLMVDVLYTIRDQWRYPILSAPESMIGSLRANSAPIIIAALWDIETGGLFYLAQRLTSIPVALVSSCISRIYLSEARAWEEEGRLREISIRTFRELLLWGLAIALACAVLAAAIAPYLIISRWEDVATYTIWLIPSALLQFAIVPISFFLQVKSKQFISLGLQIVGAHLQVGSILLCYSFEGLNPVAAFALGSAAHYLLQTVVVLRICNHYS